MEVMSTSYEEQIEALEELHKKELAAREAAIIEYERELRDLSDKYKQAVEDLKKGKEEDVKEFIPRLRRAASRIGSRKLRRLLGLNMWNKAFIISLLLFSSQSYASD